MRIELGNDEITTIWVVIREKLKNRAQEEALAMSKGGACGERAEEFTRRLEELDRRFSDIIDSGLPDERRPPSQSVVA